MPSDEAPPTGNPALARAVDEGLARIDEGTTDDAVIECWLRLEGAAADVGLGRGPAETPAELTVRVLGRTAVPTTAIERLLSLYRTARYSSHPLPASARAEAEAALREIRDRAAGHLAVRMFVRHLVACVGITVLVLVAVVLGGGAPRVELFLAVAVAVAVATVAVRRVGDATAAPPLAGADGPRAPSDEHIDARVAALEAAVRRSAEDPAAFRSRLQPVLRELAAGRLLRVHGVDPTAQPDDAERLLGSETWALLTVAARGAGGDRPSRAGRDGDRGAGPAVTDASRVATDVLRARRRSSRRQGRSRCDSCSPA